MIWMESRPEQRGSPQGLWPDVRSEIALGMNYACAADPLELAHHPDRARTSVYAQGATHHHIVKRELQAVARCAAAAAAGSRGKVLVESWEGRLVGVEGM